MFRKTRFRQGDRVNGLSLSGKKVLGVYRGMRNSFGALVYGLEVGSTEPAMHVCSVLTLEKVQVKHKKRTAKHNCKVKDPCTAYTTSGEKASGHYMNSEGKFAWIRGWLEKESKFNPPTAIKVLTETLQKL